MAVSTLVQGSTFPSSSGGTSIDTYTCRMQHTFLSGNCNIVAVQSGGSDPSTITDGTNTYNKLANVVSGGQALSIWVALNIAAGGSVISINFAASTFYVSAIIMERNNIVTASALDGSNSGVGTSNSLSVTSFTPGTANGFVVNFAVQDGTQDLVDSWTAGTNFTMELCDIFDNQMLQVWQQTTATAVTAPATKGDTLTRHWTSLAICLKTATQGNARPAGYRAIRVYHFSPSHAGAQGNSGSDTSPRAFNAPCSGDLLVIGSNFPNETLTALSDNGSNTWTVGTAYQDTVLGNSGKNQMSYETSASTASTRTITVTWSATGGDGTLMVYDIVNSGVFDKETHTSGQNSSAADFVGNSITPATANGIIVGICGIDSSVITGMTGGATLVEATTTPNIATSPVDQNNGHYLYLNPSTSALTNTYQHTAQVRSWTDVSIAFKAPAAGDTLFAQSIM